MESCCSGSRGAADRDAGERLNVLFGDKAGNFCPMSIAAADGFAIDLIAGLCGWLEMFDGGEESPSVRCLAVDTFTFACCLRALLPRIGGLTAPFSIGEPAPALGGDVPGLSKLLGLRGGDATVGFVEGAIVGSCQGL